tara:strand:+ start:274 stop:477 length:204 start_codon:yes stop_codon:yes gene_type:complete
LIFPVFYRKNKGHIMAFNAAELTAMAITYGIKFVCAIVTLVVGLMITNMLVSLTKKIMTKGQVNIAY